MPRLPSRLVRSPYGVYSFRLVLPPHLVVSFGKREIWRSLYTKDSIRARFFAYSLNFAAMTINTKEDLDRFIAQLNSLQNKPESRIDGLGELVIKGANFGKFRADEITIDNSSDAAAKRDKTALLALIQEANGVQSSIAAFEAKKAQEYPNSLLLSACIKLYLDNNRTNFAQSTLQDYATILAGFLRFNGTKTKIQALGQDKLVKYFDFLSYLPTNFEKRSNKDFQGMSALDFVSKAKAQGVRPPDAVSIQTQKQHQRILSAFFNWLIDSHSYNGNNPCAGLVKVTQRKKQQLDASRGYLAFSDDELEKIFSAKTYLPFTKNNPDNHFAPLLALYTGARLNEIMQIRVQDFRQVNGTYFLDIALDLSDDEAQQTSVKTLSSIRSVPLHPDIITMGFVDYVKKRKEENAIRIFNATKDIKGKFTKSVSRDFSAYLHNLGLKPTGDRKHSAHSLRKNYVQRLQSQNIPADIRRQLVGHAPIDEHGKKYSGKYTIPQLAEMIFPCLNFSFIDVNALKY